jgi:hypothetical protein
MKTAQIKIKKERLNGGKETKFHYPAGYNDSVSPFIYELDSTKENPDEDSMNVEYCLASVPDDFTFTKDMVEVDKATAETLVDKFVDKFPVPTAKQITDGAKTVDEVKVSKRSFIPAK